MVARHPLPRTVPVAGMTLLEILIAVGILVSCALLLIQGFRQSGMKQEAFTSEHFTAMFLAQKVLEDISDRVSVNPHYFNQLIAGGHGEPLAVIDGKSPFFRLLENTKDYTRLSAAEDGPITKDSGSLYDQLKGFTCKLDTDFVPDPDNPGQSFKNLIEVTVTINWKESTGHAQSYHVTQRLYGFNEDILRFPGQEKIPPIGEQLAVKALYEWLDPKSNVGMADINSFLSFNGGGDPEIVKSIGSMLAGLLMCDASVREFDWTINKAKRELYRLLGRRAKPAEIAKLKEHLAGLREQKACTIFYIFSRLREDLAGLRLYKIDASALGDKLFQARGAISQVPILLLNHLMKISMGFASAEGAYRELILPPDPGVSLNRRISLVHHWLDLRKLGLLMAYHWKLDVKSRLDEHRKVLGRLMALYEGRQPGFMEYLATEKEYGASIDAMQKALAGLSRNIQDTLGSGESLQQIFTHLKP